MFRRRLCVEGLEVRRLLISDGWDGPGQGSAELTYYIGEIPAEIDEVAFEEAIADAFAAWTDVADIEVRKTSLPRQRSSIDITFEELDGPGDTLAQAFFPDPFDRFRRAGDVTFDSGDEWEFGNARGNAATDVLYVAVHEIGHALGLEHNEESPSSVMYPRVSRTQTFSRLTDADVDAILEIYAPRVSPVLGDFDSDGLVDATDINLLLSEIAAGDDDEIFDLNTDGQVDGEDRDILILDVLDSTYGDANLDGVFNTDDIVFVFQSGFYLDSARGPAAWMTGDWNGDGRFDPEDLVLAFQQGDFVGAA